MTVKKPKPKPKQLPQPITKGADSAMNQSQFLAVICNSLKAWEKSHVHGAIGFGFASRWLKNWCESFEPITKRSNRSHVITFDGHLKTTLIQLNKDLYGNKAFSLLVLFTENFIVRSQHLQCTTNGICLTLSPLCRNGQQNLKNY